MKKFILFLISITFTLSLSACANLPIIGDLFAGSFESQIERLEENGWRDFFSDDSEITIIFGFEQDGCAEHYCFEDIEQYVFISKGDLFSDFSFAVILEFKNTRLVRDALDSLSSSDSYDDDELYSRSNILYIITGEYKEEFKTILSLNP